jgi:hypothetical protein
MPPRHGIMYRAVGFQPEVMKHYLQDKGNVSHAEPKGMKERDDILNG